VTIPEYDFATRRKLPPAFPPVASVQAAPNQFDQSYVGSKEIRQKLRRALTLYVAGQLRFWQYTIWIGLVGALGIAFTARGMPGWYLPVVVVIVVLGALLMPFRVAVGVRHAADTYALEGETYSSSFDQENIFWRTATDTYEIPWTAIDRPVFKRDVTILTLKSSRAICVLPDELITPDARSRFQETERTRRERS
jgi:hypothetical protein